MAPDSPDKNYVADGNPISRETRWLDVYVYMCSTLYICVSHIRYVNGAMGWLRLVGSLKLQVSYAEYRLFYMALLQKRPMILSSLRIVATPYSYFRQVQLTWFICIYVFHTFICVTWLLHTCDMTDFRAKPGDLIYMYICVPYMCSAAQPGCAESLWQNVVSFIGLFCKRAL